MNGSCRSLDYHRLCFYKLIRAATPQGRLSDPTLFQHVQVLTTIGFLSTGMERGDSLDVSQSSVSRVLPLVIEALMRLSARYIKFPLATCTIKYKLRETFMPLLDYQHPSSNRLYTCTHQSAFPWCIPPPQPHKSTSKLYQMQNTTLLSLLDGLGERVIPLCCKIVHLGRVRPEGAHGDGWLIGSF